MKNEIEQELDQKEFENEIGRDLKLEYENLEAEQRKYKNTNKYVIAAIHFFGTLFFCYLLLFIVRFFFGSFMGGLGMLGVNLAWLNPLIHGAIWVAAVFSVYRKRSLVDDLINRFI